MKNIKTVLLLIAFKHEEILVVIWDKFDIIWQQYEICLILACILLLTMKLQKTYEA